MLAKEGAFFSRLRDKRPIMVLFSDAVRAGINCVRKCTKMAGMACRKEV